MSVIKEIEDYHQEMIGWRRDIHAHPELGFEEFRTSTIVADKLEQWDIETHREIAGTGVVGIIYGKGKSTVSIGLRAVLQHLYQYYRAYKYIIYGRKQTKHKCFVAITPQKQSPYLAIQANTCEIFNPFETLSSIVFQYKKPIRYMCSNQSFTLWC